MLLPRIFENNFADSFFNDKFFDDMFSFPTNFISSSRLMNTDVQDLGEEYQLEIELPGYEKKDIRAELKNGYLTIYGDKQDSREEKRDNGRYVRRERYSGKCRRSFYVGDYLKEEDIRASFKNGILKIKFPKDKGTPQIEDKKYIPIE